MSLVQDHWIREGCACISWHLWQGLHWVLGCVGWLALREVLGSRLERRPRNHLRAGPSLTYRWRLACAVLESIHTGYWLAEYSDVPLREQPQAGTELECVVVGDCAAQFWVHWQVGWHCRGQFIRLWWLWEVLCTLPPRDETAIADWRAIDDGLRKPKISGASVSVHLSGWEMW